MTENSSTMRKMLVWSLLVVIACWLQARPVAAHVQVVRSEPPPDAQLTVAPTVVRLFLSDSVAARSVQLKLFTAQRSEVPTTGGAVDPADATLLVLPLPVLEAGVYTLVWQATGSDGHPITGHLVWTVLGPPTITSVGSTPSSTPAPRATPTPLPLPAPSATAISTVGRADRSTPSATPLRWLVLPGVAGLVGGLVLLARTLRQRREPPVGLSFGQKLAWSAGTIAISVLVVAMSWMLGSVPTPQISSQLRDSSTRAPTPNVQATAAATTTSLSNLSTSVPTASAAAFEAVQPAGDVQVRLVISPAAVARQTLRITLSDAQGQPLTVQRVRLDAELLSQPIGIKRIDFEPAEPGVYVLEQTLLSMVGDWELTVLVRREGADDVTAIFKVPLTQAAR